MAQQTIYRKPGQIWNLNRPSYPLRRGPHLIVGFQRRRIVGDDHQWINDTDYIRMRPLTPLSNGDMRPDRPITRRALTTHGGLWNYVGTDDTEPHIMRVTCIRCGGSEVREFKYAPANYVCSVCSS